MFFAITQSIAASFSGLMLKAFTRFEVHGQENLTALKRPLLVVANHKSHLDPQLVGVALFSRLSLFPLRYMAKNQLFYYPILGQLIWLLGAFPAHKKKGIGKSLLKPVQILERGGAVIMFPEGHITPTGPNVTAGRRGAAILALTTRAQLLPMSLQTPANFNPWHFLFKRESVIVRIGEPFYLNNTDFLDLSDENTTAATKVIMGKISDLYYKKTAD